MSPRVEKTRLLGNRGGGARYTAVQKGGTKEEDLHRYEDVGKLSTVIKVGSPFSREEKLERVDGQLDYFPAWADKRTKPSFAT